MKKAFFVVVAAAAISAAAAAQNATTVYVEGDASTRKLSGGIVELDIGTDLKVGESVITKEDGRADLELSNKSTISVKPNTVFTIGEVEVEGEKQTVLSTAVGAVSYRLNKFSGRGPSIRTNSYVAGVRGTELTVYAGMDGSALLVVEKGAVEVSSQGKAVELGVNEAVEVKPGRTPGEKFTWLGRHQDFSAWNKGREEAFLADPVGRLKDVETQLARFREDLRAVLKPLAEADKESARVYEELKKAVEAKDDAKAAGLRSELLTGIGEKRRTLFLNMRHYALSYLSMRRYVLGGMYVQMKSRYILKQDAPEYREFMSLYHSVRKNYEDAVVPHLVEADI